MENAEKKTLSTRGGRSGTSNIAAAAALYLHLSTVEIKKKNHLLFFLAGGKVVPIRGKQGQCAREEAFSLV